MFRVKFHNILAPLIYFPVTIHYLPLLCFSYDKYLQKENARIMEERNPPKIIKEKGNEL